MEQLEENEEESETDETMENSEEQKSSDETAEPKENSDEEIDTSELEEQIVPDNIIEDNGFSGGFYPGEFVAPVLEASETPQEIQTLEDVTQNAPATSNSNSPSQQNISYADFSQSEQSEREYEARREMETRFVPTDGLIAGTSDTITPIRDPYPRGLGGGMNQNWAPGDELAEFSEEQKKYQEKIEDETSLPFRRSRRTKGF